MESKKRLVVYISNDEFLRKFVPSYLKKHIDVFISGYGQDDDLLAVLSQESDPIVFIDGMGIEWEKLKQSLLASKKKQMDVFLISSESELEGSESFCNEITSKIVPKPYRVEDLIVFLK